MCFIPEQTPTAHDKAVFFSPENPSLHPLVKKVKGSAREDVDIRRVMAQRADEE